MTADEMLRELGYEKSGSIRLKVYTRCDDEKFDEIRINVKEGIVEKNTMVVGSNLTLHWMDGAEIRAVCKLLDEMEENNEPN